MYKRVIRLEARRELTGEPFFVTEELRVHCEMEMSLAQQLTQAKVTIYNLSRETSNALCYGDHEAGSVGTAESLRRASKVYIRLYAGYEDERLSTGQLPQLLEGIVMNASAQRRLPDHLTHLYVLPLSSSFMRQTFDPFPATSGMTLKEALTKICQLIGFSSISFDLSDKILAQSVRGKTFIAEPDAYHTLHQLGKTYGFTFAQKASGIGFYPKLNDSAFMQNEFNHLQESGAPYIVNPILLNGVPTAGVMTITVPIILDGRIFPGWVIDVSQIQGTRGDLALPSQGLIDYTSMGKDIYYQDDMAKYAVFRKYMAERVVHKLDNYSTLWSTVIVGIIPTVGDFGNGEQRG